MSTELSKSNVARLIVVASVTGLICLCAVGLMGYSLSEYWRFNANREFEQKRLSGIQAQAENCEKKIKELESEKIQKLEEMAKELAQAQRNIDLIEERRSVYIALTNAIAESRAEEKSVQQEVNVLASKRTELIREEERTRTALGATNVLLETANVELARLNKEILEALRKKKEFDDVEKLLPEKRQELEMLECSIRDKNKERDMLMVSIDGATEKWKHATTNLFAVTKTVDQLQNTEDNLKKSIDGLKARLAEKQLEQERLEKILEELTVATNKLNQEKILVRKEIAEAKRDTNAELAEKRKSAEEQLEIAKARVVEAEGKAATIISSAKQSAEKISQAAQIDKVAGEQAKLEKVKADMAVARAREENRELQEQKNGLDEDIGRLKKDRDALKGELNSIKKGNVERGKLSQEMSRLRDQEADLRASIPTKKQTLQALKKSDESSEDVSAPAKSE